MRRASAAATPQHQPPHQQEGASDDAITLASVSSALGVGVDSSGVHSLSSLLRPTAVGELERPGAVVAQPARVPFTAWKPLKPKIQSIIDSRLIALRRKEHPEWLDKQSVRKMTLRERQTLVRQRTGERAFLSFCFFSSLFSSFLFYSHPLRSSATGSGRHCFLAMSLCAHYSLLHKQSESTFL
jgi:hypothetical protein